MLKPIFFAWLSVALIFSLRATMPPALATATPTFTVSVTSAFLRNAPNAQAPATYSVFQGQAFPILARNTDNSWLQLDYPRANKGTWILATLGKITGDLTSIPVIQANSSYTATTSVPANSATIEPTPTPASTDPSEICVLLYNDTNGNGMLDTNEGAITGGQLTILETSTGEVLQTYTTAAGDTASHCFKDLPAGSYTVAATAPAGYNATSDASILLKARAGEHYEMTFGAQLGAGALSSGQTSSFLTALYGGLGIAVLLLAAGFAAFVIVRRK